MLIILVNITYRVFPLTCLRFEQTRFETQFAVLFISKASAPLIHTSQNNELVLLTLI